MSENWLLIKRDLYECPGHLGYTGIRDNAGRYSKEEADKHAAHYGPNSVVLESEAPEFRKAAFQDLVIAHLKKQRDADRNAALEEAAKALEARAPELSGPDYGLASEDERKSMRTYAGICMKHATAIRALIERESKAPPKREEAP